MDLTGPMLTALLLTLALSTVQADPPVSVYVFTQTNASGLTDANQQSRTAAADRLKRELAKKKALGVVDSSDGARVAIEILESGPKASGVKEAALGQIKDVERDHVLIRLSAGDYHVDMESFGKRANGSGPYPEESMAKAVEQWVKDNRATLASAK